MLKVPNLVKARNPLIQKFRSTVKHKQFNISFASNDSHQHATWNSFPNHIFYERQQISASIIELQIVFNKNKTTQ